MDQKYTVPENMRIYAIGDLHGYADLLDKMHAAIVADASDGAANDAPGDVRIVYLGDYIDRGPDTKGVIDLLIESRDRDDGFKKTFLKGNHEAGMYEFMDDPVHARWLNWGGIETLASYGIVFDDPTDISAEQKIEAADAMRRDIPSVHFEFLESLELSATFGDYFFAHAGVDPLKGVDEQAEDDLTRIRQPFLSWHENLLYKPFDKRVVHGHTPSNEPIERPHRIGVDTHAYESGVLTAVVLEGEDVRFLSVSNEA